MRIMNFLLNSYFKTIKKLISGKSDNISVGLDIGTGDCKLVEIRQSGDHFELLNWVIEPLIDGDLVATVRKTLDQLKTPCKSLYTSISGKGALIRYMDMPQMSLTDLKSSFVIEADKYFPFAQDQIYTDCFIVNEKASGNQMRVMAAAAKKELVDERMTLLTELGLQPNLIGVNSIAAANIFSELDFTCMKDKDSVVAILDMGEITSNLTIIIDKKPWFTRDIFIGGRELTKRISNALGVDVQEAEKLKRQPGDKQEEVISACESAVINTVKELKLSFDYFTTEGSHEVSKLLLTGGASLLGGLTETLEKHLEIEVALLDPMEPMELSANLSADELEKDSLKLGVALGLALYHYDRN